MFLKNTFFEFSSDEVKKAFADSLSVLAKSVAGQPVNKDIRNDSNTIIKAVQKEIQAHTAYMQAAANIIGMTSLNKEEAEQKVKAVNLLPQMNSVKQLSK